MSVAESKLCFLFLENKVAEISSADDLDVLS